MKLLTDKTALVTGASRGIGRAVALKLAQGGAKVIINYRRSDAAANELAEQIKNNGGSAVCIKADVSSIDSVKEMVDIINKEHGGLDILVNNAGILVDKPLTDTGDDELDNIFATNLNSVFYVVKLAAKAMIKKRYGKIINIASAAAFGGYPGLSAYSASKGAVVAMTKSMARELGGRNIRVNCVAPGFIETEMTSIYPAEMIEGVLRSASIKRIGTPEDIANAVYFLSTPDSDYITGQVLHVNGGIY